MEEPLLLKIEEAARLLSIGRSRAYVLAAAGDLPTVKIGLSTRVPVQALRLWVDKKSQIDRGKATRRALERGTEVTA